MITVVFDTNTLASGIITEKETLSTIINAWRTGAFTVVVSVPILQELERTLEKPYFTQRLTATQRARFLALVERQAQLTPLTGAVQGIATHPEDDLILATAISAQADYLMTGDRKLRDLGSFAGVTIVSPRVFLDRLEEHEKEP